MQARAGGREFELARMDLAVGTDDVDGIDAGHRARRDRQRHDRQRHRRAVRFPRAAIAGRRAAGIARRSLGPGGMAGARVGDDWSFTLRNLTDAVLVRDQRRRKAGR